MREADPPCDPRVAAHVHLPEQIAEADIAENRGARRVGGADGGLAADGPRVALVEIERPGDVGGDDVVAPADAVHLHGQAHGNAVFLQVPGQIDGRGAAETLAEEHERGGLRLRGADPAVAVAVEAFQQDPPDELAVVIARRFHVHAGQATLAQAQREAPHAAAVVVPALPAAEKPDDKHRAVRQRDRRRPVASPEAPVRRRPRHHGGQRQRGCTGGDHFFLSFFSGSAGW